MAIAAVLAGAMGLWLVCGFTGVARSQAPDNKPQAIWLWGGKVDHALIEQAKTLYVLQGEVRLRHGQPTARTITVQGAPVPRNKAVPTWLVYRTQTLQWDGAIAQSMMERVRQWREAGNQVVGIQIDFDASTSKLSQYGAFLRSLRHSLTPDLQLGVTGLLDWTNRSDADGVNQLASVIDEIVIQTYQGKTTVDNAAVYLKRLDTLRLPFKVGLVQGGKEIGYRDFESNPLFGGYVLFPITPRQ